MRKLGQCEGCGGFVAPAMTACPHCGALVVDGARALGRIGRGVMALAGGSAFAVTLMACYGAPYEPTVYCDDLSKDTDGDGYCGGFDCDETNVAIYEGAADTEGDGIDQNCDGVDGTAAADGGT